MKIVDTSNPIPKYLQISFWLKELIETGRYQRGEQLPSEALEKAQHESSTCSTMLVIGTSAVVQPAASLPFLAKQTGAVVIEVNPEKSFPVADYYIPEKAGVALSGILQEVKKLKNSAT